MGVHTGDSITVAPAQTLTDKEYQRMRDAARRIIRRVGVETGGSNIQFAVNPADGRMTVIEMNPRVSRSSALASKATGFPIARSPPSSPSATASTRIPNDITRVTPASFEPTIDYVVVKIRAGTSREVPAGGRTLTTQRNRSARRCRSGGRSRKPSSRGSARWRWAGPALPPPDRVDPRPGSSDEPDEEETALRRGLVVPTDRRMWSVFRALDRGWSVERVHADEIDPWFLEQFAELVELRRTAEMIGLRDMSAEPADAEARRLRRSGLGDILGADASAVRERRRELGLVPAYKRIDTCAAEFESFTPYNTQLRGRLRGGAILQPKVIILGSGPNRIGQGIEFDYCCCHAVFGFAKEQFETIMVNCSPETVSTDYDTADRLYFEPLTFEDVMAVIERERQGHPRSPASCSSAARRRSSWLAPAGAGVTIRHHPDSIDLAEDRSASRNCCGIGIPQRPAGRRFARGRAWWRRGSASRSSSGRRASSAGATWPSSTTWRRWTAT